MMEGDNFNGARATDYFIVLSHLSHNNHLICGRPWTVRWAPWKSRHHNKHRLAS